MIDLVTIQEARDHLRIDDVDVNGGPDFAWLSVFIPAVSQAVASWVKTESRLYVPTLDSNGDPELDSNGETVPELNDDGDPTPTALTKAAVLVELERQYRSRGGEDETDMEKYSQAGYGYTLGKGSTALLYGSRKPTLA